jgi:hypothetical protein
LRQGLPVADICYLLPEGAPQVFRPPSSAVRGNPPDRRSYNFDACAPGTLVERARVQNGGLVFPDGMSYRVLVLPDQPAMTPGLLNKIRELVKDGLTILGPPPARSPSLTAYPECDREIQRVSAELWGNCDGTRVTQHACGTGNVIWRKDAMAGRGHFDPYGDYNAVADVLLNQGVVPDFEEPTGSLRYTHRTTGDEEFYFVANTNNSHIKTECRFRVTGKEPELWDPVSGRIRECANREYAGGRTALTLSLAPQQSTFVVFHGKPGTRRTAKPPVGERREAMELKGPWVVSFDPKRGGPARVEFKNLSDWSTRPEPEIRYFSGIALYGMEFDTRDLGIHGRERLVLDLGVVKCLARVRLNGKDLGVVWCAPWQVELGKTLRPGKNRLEIEVANLWPNRLIGDEQFPADCDYNPDGALARWPEWLLDRAPRPSRDRLTFATWRLFRKDSPLLPSGLLGPVTILAGDE